MAEPLHDLRDADAASVAAARAIYEAGFPAVLRAPWQDLVAVRTDERTQLLRDAGSADVIALALSRDLGDTPWTFLRYFVVDASRRGQGVGGRLWRALLADLSGRGRDLLLFDVEAPDDPGAGDAELHERRRRVAFYERLGASLLPVPDYAPPAHGEPGEPMPLRLMGAPVTHHEGWTAPLVEAAVRAVYRHRYDV